MRNDRQHPASALLDHLDAEAEALLQGKIDQAVEGAEEKDALLKALRAGGEISPEMRARIVAAAERNGRLLHAASEGLQAAIRRLGDLRDLRDGKGTYGADGGRQSQGRPGGRIEKRV